MAAGAGAGAAGAAAICWRGAGAGRAGASSAACWRAGGAGAGRGAGAGWAGAAACCWRGGVTAGVCVAAGAGRRLSVRRGGRAGDRAVGPDRDGAHAARLAERGGGVRLGRRRRHGGAGRGGDEAGSDLRAGRHGRGVGRRRALPAGTRQDDARGRAGRGLHVDGLLLAVHHAGVARARLGGALVDLLVLVRDLDAARVLRLNAGRAGLGADHGRLAAARRGGPADAAKADDRAHAEHGDAEQRAGDHQPLARLLRLKAAHVLLRLGRRLGIVGGRRGGEGLVRHAATLLVEVAGFRQARIEVARIGVRRDGGRGGDAARGDVLDSNRLETGVVHANVVGARLDHRRRGRNRAPQLVAQHRVELVEDLLLGGRRDGSGGLRRLRGGRAPFGGLPSRLRSRSSSEGSARWAPGAAAGAATGCAAFFSLKIALKGSSWPTMRASSASGSPPAALGWEPAVCLSWRSRSSRSIAKRDFVWSDMALSASRATFSKPRDPYAAS